MANKARKRKQEVPGRSKISAQEKLHTLNLYLNLGNSNRVAERLGISGAAVRDRLYAMGVKTPGPGEHDLGPMDVNTVKEIARLRMRLHIRAQKE